MSLVFYENKTNDKKTHTKISDTSDNEKNNNCRNGYNKNEGKHHLSSPLKLEAFTATITTEISTAKRNDHNDWEINKNKNENACAKTKINQVTHYHNFTLKKNKFEDYETANTLMKEENKMKTTT